jgi:hypothetical protein
MNDLEEELKGMVTPKDDLDYIAVTLLGTSAGAQTWEVYSHWAGSTVEEPRLELRKASHVNAVKMINLWENQGQSHLVVHDEKELFLFLLLGGNALVAVEVAQAHSPEWLNPTPVTRHGMAGYISADTLPATAFRRAPTPKERMEVLNRDGRRCRICGRKPDDHVDLELHVHHIRPWADGGLTYTDNLITLCHTCHAGLDPHADSSLFDYLGIGMKALRREASAKTYWEGVKRYRAGVRNLLASAKSLPDL